jgi:hypothetical protein
MRRVPALLVFAALSLVAQAPRAQASLPVVAWCVSSPGADDYCSPVEERILAAVRKRLAAGGGDWAIGEGISVTRVQ